MWSLPFMHFSTHLWPTAHAGQFPATEGLFWCGVWCLSLPNAADAWKKFPFFFPLLENAVLWNRQLTGCYLLQLDRMSSFKLSLICFDAAASLAANPYTAILPAGSFCQLPQIAGNPPPLETKEPFPEHSHKSLKEGEVISWSKNATKSEPEKAGQHVSGCRHLCFLHLLWNLIVPFLSAWKLPLSPFSWVSISLSSVMRSGSSDHGFIHSSRIPFSSRNVRNAEKTGHSSPALLTFSLMCLRLSDGGSRKQESEGGRGEVWGWTDTWQKVWGGGFFQTGIWIKLTFSFLFIGLKYILIESNCRGSKTLHCMDFLMKHEGQSTKLQEM